MTSSAHFTLHELAPGIHAAVARPGGTAVSNAAIIDLGDRTLVVDTFQTQDAAQDLLAAARRLTGRGAAVVVNSHWHGDHVGGNQVFEGAEIIATPRTVELVAQHGTPPEQYTSELDDYVASLQERIADTENDDERARYRVALVTAETLVREAPRFRLTLPAPMRDEALEIVGAERDAEVLTYGPGHTESDAFVHLPAEGIVVAGDLLWVNAHPRTQDGEPAAWAAALDRMAALGPQVVVPGHGDVGGPQHLAGMAAYLREVDDMVAALRANPDIDPLQRFAPPEGSETWAGPSRLWEGVRLLAAPQH
jgi:glyoxylase-like metal-dependent hydrolase (beta-lactamase superfamily II)